MPFLWNIVTALIAPNRYPTMVVGIGAHPEKWETAFGQDAR